MWCNVTQLFVSRKMGPKKEPKLSRFLPLDDTARLPALLSSLTLLGSDTMQDLEEGTCNIPVQSIEVHTRASDSILKSGFETHLSYIKSGKSLSVSIWGRGLVLFYLPGVATISICKLDSTCISLFYRCGSSLYLSRELISNLTSIVTTRSRR